MEETDIAETLHYEREKKNIRQRRIFVTLARTFPIVPFPEIKGLRLHECPKLGRALAADREFKDREDVLVEARLVQYKDSIHLVSIYKDKMTLEEKAKLLDIFHRFTLRRSK